MNYKKISHIYYFSFYNSHSPSTRYRAKYPLEHLEKNYKITYTWICPGYQPAQISRFILAYVSVLLFRKKNSLIIYQKIYSNGIYANLLKLLLLIRPTETAYDIDDAEYIRFDDKSIIFFMNRCAVVFAGSNELIKYAGKYNKSRLLLTSPVIRSTHIKSGRNSILTIGWIGDYGTSEDDHSLAYSHRTSLSELIFPALNDLNFPVKFIMIGVNNLSDRLEIGSVISGNRNISLEMITDIDWHDEEYLHTLISQFDIGLAPLIDHEFNRAKSAFKLKQYFSCGVPALASPTGENKVFLKDGVNGFLCRSKEEFIEKLIEVNSMTDLQYRTLSEAALTCAKDFDMDNYCRILLQMPAKDTPDQRQALISL